jgi:hypothetical protein
MDTNNSNPKAVWSGDTINFPRAKEALIVKLNARGLSDMILPAHDPEARFAPGPFNFRYRKTIEHFQFKSDEESGAFLLVQGSRVPIMEPPAGAKPGDDAIHFQPVTSASATKQLIDWVTATGYDAQLASHERKQANWRSDVGQFFTVIGPENISTTACLCFTKEMAARDPRGAWEKLVASGTPSIRDSLSNAISDRANQQWQSGRLIDLKAEFDRKTTAVIAYNPKFAEQPPVQLERAIRIVCTPHNAVFQSTIEIFQSSEAASQESEWGTMMENFWAACRSKEISTLKGYPADATLFHYRRDNQRLYDSNPYNVFPNRRRPEAHANGAFTFGDFDIDTSVPDPRIPGAPTDESDSHTHASTAQRDTNPWSNPYPSSGGKGAAAPGEDCQFRCGGSRHPGGFVNCPNARKCNICNWFNHKDDRKGCSGPNHDRKKAAKVNGGRGFGGKPKSANIAAAAVTDSPFGTTSAAVKYTTDDIMSAFANLTTEVRDHQRANDFRQRAMERRFDEDSDSMMESITSRHRQN